MVRVHGWVCCLQQCRYLVSPDGFSLYAIHLVPAPVTVPIGLRMAQNPGSVTGDTFSAQMGAFLPSVLISCGFLTGVFLSWGPLSTSVLSSISSLDDSSQEYLYPLNMKEKLAIHNSLYAMLCSLTLHSQTKFLTCVYLGAGGAVVYATGVFLFSDTRSGMLYVLDDQVQNVPDWLTDRKFGLWHVLEFAGSLTSMFFMVRVYM